MVYRYVGIKNTRHLVQAGKLFRGQRVGELRKPFAFMATGARRISSRTLQVCDAVPIQHAAKHQIGHPAWGNFTLGGGGEVVRA